VELALHDALAHPLVAGVEAPRVAAHRDLAARLGGGHHGLAVLEHVAERNLHLHMLAGLQAGHRLRRVHLRRRAQDDGVDFLDLQAVGEVGGDVRDAVLVGHFLRLGELAAHHRHHLHAVDQLDGVEVLDAEGAGTGEGDVDGHVFSRIRWPTAVLLAGT
jgi:hypothetical protein